MITLDVTGRAPIYDQLCQSICGEIAKGLLKEHERLPAARVLAKDLGINPNTVAKAYAMLERDGVIYSVAGRGCFVAEHKGAADRRFTDAFEEKAREAMKAGVPKSVLTGILDDIYGGERSATETGGKEND